jgi:hypothetical protein
MVVKFKVGFTMSAETLFGIIAKFVPVEDLQVEEIEPHAKPKVEKIHRLAGPENRLKPPSARANRHTGMSLESGVNGVIMRVLEDGQAHRYRDIKKAVGAAGYAPTGIGSKLARLRELNAIASDGVGVWRIGEAKKTA